MLLAQSVGVLCSRRAISAAKPICIRQHALKRLQSTITHHAAAPDAAREVPTPLVFMSAARWTGERPASEQFSAFIPYFTAQGWNVTCLDLDPQGKQPGDEQQSSAILQHLETELVEQLRQASNASGPFPPLLVAHGLSTLVAETFVSSNALSGMALFDPLLNAAKANELHPDRFPTPLPAFTYEPRFPCLVAWSPEKAKELAFWEVHRIEEQREEDADESLDRYVWKSDEEKEVENAGPYELRQWAEENGIIVANAIDADERSEQTSIDDQVSEAPSLPVWYTQGSYERNPSKSKKEPLLLDDAHLEESFIRGSGPGGQAINKLATCVQLKHTPTGLVFRCQDTRSRQQNREFARRRMSRELELRLFGPQDSVLGRAAIEERRKKAAKSRKRRRRQEDDDEVEEKQS